MKELFQQYKFYSHDRWYRSSAPFAALMFLLSLVANFYASYYATEVSSNPVTDIILSNIRVFNVDDFFVYGTLVLIIFTALLGFSHPKHLPFIFHSFALFYVTRSVFVTLTHLGAFPGHVILDVGTFTQKFLGGNDLFFSGHTGVPFLLALMFWNFPKLRYTFLGWSVFFAVIVLLGHLHYSIDVLSAFFITYTIFCMAKAIFKKDYQVFQTGLSPSP